MKDTGERDDDLAERILEAAPLAIYVFDVHEQRTTYVNPGIYHSLGYAADDFHELGPAFISRIMHPDDQPGFIAHLARVGHATDGEFLTFEHRMRAKDGSWHWFRSRDCALSRSADGKLEQILGCAEDITERQELEEERERLIAIAEGAGDLVALARPDGTVLYVNRAGRELISMPDDAPVESLQVRDFHPPEDIDRLFEAAIRDGSARTEMPLFTLSGREIPVSVIITTHRDADGEIAYFSGIIRDISDQQRAAEEIRRLNADLERRIAATGAELEAAVRELEGLPHEVAAELSETLATVRSAVDILLRDHGDSLGEAGRQDLARVLAAAERLQETADGLVSAPAAQT